MFFACIFVPDFPVEAILRAEPDLRSYAVAVLDGKAPRQKVFAQNENASRAGVEPGMAKLELEACGNIVLRCRSQLQEDAAHAALLDCAQSFSPRVEDIAWDTILIDLAGLEPLFGPLPKIARDLARRASDLGLESNVAVASNPDTAVIAARGFSGVTLIPQGKEAEQLGGLPIEILFAGQRSRSTSEHIVENLGDYKDAGKATTSIGSKKVLKGHGFQPCRTSSESISGAAESRAPSKPVSTATISYSGTISVLPQAVSSKNDDQKQSEQILDTLNRWGIRNLRSLAALPDVALSERLGQGGLHLQKLARGETFRTLTPVEPLLVFEEAIELEHPLVLLEPLAFLLGQLLEQLCARLSARALATQELRLRLELDSSCHEEGTEPRSNKAGDVFERTLRLPVPLLDAKIFLKLLQLDLNANPPGAPILKIHLRAEPVRPRAAQGGLFLPPSPEPEKLELTLARIAGIVGEDKIGSLALLDTYRSEGFRMQRFSPASQENPKNTGERNNAAVTALRIFRPAIPVMLTLQGGIPARIACHERKDVQGDILWSAGPWRSSGDWWETESWSRDEWDIAVQAETEITLYRLVKDLLAGRWFVEGVYD
jgi:nucleotidyltransferase/DNA polymerase involved in DNA repair